MTGLVLGKGHVEGLGEVYVFQADRPDYLAVTVIKTGARYLRRRKDVSWRPGKYKNHGERPDGTPLVFEMKE